MGAYFANITSVNANFKQVVINEGEQQYVSMGTNDNYAFLYMPNISILGDGSITCVSVTQTSLESEKKNFNKLENALNIIKNIDIYKYNMKNEEQDTKKHIGFVIGDKYKYSEEVTSKNNDGVDIYNFVSVCCKAIQEQQEQIEELKSRIEKLEKGE